MLAALGMVEVEFERGDGEFRQRLPGFGNELPAQAFVGAQEAGVALLGLLPANVVPVAVVPDAVGLEVCSGQHHAGQQKQLFLIVVEMLLGSFLGQVEVFDDVDVKVFQHRASGFLGACFEFGLEAGLQQIELGIDLIAAFAALVNLVNVAFDIDAGFDAAENFVGGAKDAFEQAEFLAEEFKDPFVGPVALVDEIDHDDIVFLAVTMDSADALFDPLRIPGQVVIDQQRAELEVDTLGSGFGTDENFSRFSEVINKSGFHVGCFGAGNAAAAFVLLQPVLVDALGIQVGVAAVEDGDLVGVAIIGEQFLEAGLGADRFREDDGLALAAQALGKIEGLAEHAQQGVGLGIAGNAFGEGAEILQLAHFRCQGCGIDGVFFIDARFVAQVVEGVVVFERACQR